MKAVFSSVFWIAVALGLAAWGLYVVDTTSYAKMGNVHDIADSRIEVDGSLAEVFQQVSGLTVDVLERQTGADEAIDTPEEASPIQRSGRRGESMLELPALQEFGTASLLLVEHRLPDFLMFQERYRKIIFLHGLGFEEVSPGVTEISWQIQSPNTQWWFHGFILHPAMYYWNQQISQVLKNIKKNMSLNNPE